MRSSAIEQVLLERELEARLAEVERRLELARRELARWLSAMKTAAKARLLARRDELLRAAIDDQDDGQTELEHGDAETPLEADEPEVERSHPGAERGEDDVA